MNHQVQWSITVTSNNTWVTPLMPSYIAYMRSYCARRKGPMKSVSISVLFRRLISFIQYNVCCHAVACWAFNSVSVALSQWAAGSLKSCVADEVDVGTKQMVNQAPLLIPAKFSKCVIKIVIKKSICHFLLGMQMLRKLRFNKKKSI